MTMKTTTETVQRHTFTFAFHSDQQKRVQEAGDDVDGALAEHNIHWITEIITPGTVRLDLESRTGALTSGGVALAEHIVESTYARSGIGAIRTDAAAQVHPDTAAFLGIQDAVHRVLFDADLIPTEDELTGETLTVGATTFPHDLEDPAAVNAAFGSAQAQIAALMNSAGLDQEVVLVHTAIPRIRHTTITV